MVRCTGTHNRAALTDEWQDCAHGFFVQITVTGAIPAHAIDVTNYPAFRQKVKYQNIKSLANMN